MSSHKEPQKTRLENALSNTFQMIFFGLLEGLWIPSTILFVICLIFGKLSIFFIIFIGFWATLIISNAIMNDNFWK